MARCLTGEDDEYCTVQGLAVSLYCIRLIYCIHYTSTDSVGTGIYEVAAGAVKLQVLRYIYCWCYN